MNTSSITSPQSLPQLQDTVSGGTKMTVSEYAKDAIKQGLPLTLTVVKVNRTHTSLQIQSSNQKIRIANETLSVNPPLKEGDKLILTGVRNERAKLIVQSAENQNIPPIANALARQLAKQWKDISMHDLSKAAIFPTATTRINTYSAVLQLASNIMKFGGVDVNKDLKYGVSLDIKSKTIQVSEGRQIGTVSLRTRGAPVSEITLSSDALADLEISPKDRLKIEIVNTNKGTIIGNLALEKANYQVSKLSLTKSQIVKLNESLSVSSKIALDKLLQQNIFVLGEQGHKQSQILLPASSEIVKSVKGLESIQKSIIPQNDSQGSEQLLVTQERDGKSKYVQVQLVSKPRTIFVPIHVLHHDSSSAKNPTNEHKPQQNSVEDNISQTQQTRTIKNKSSGEQLYKNTIDDRVFLPSRALVEQFKTLSQIDEHAVSSKLQSNIKNLLLKTDAPVDPKLQQLINEIFKGLLKVTQTKLDTPPLNAIKLAGKQTNNTTDASTNANSIPVIDKQITRKENTDKAATEFPDIPSNTELKQLHSSLLTDGMLTQAIRTPKPANNFVEALVNLLIVRLLPSTSAPASIQQQLTHLLLGKSQIPQFTKQANQVSSKNRTESEHGSHTQLLNGIRQIFNQRSLNTLKSADNTIQSSDSLYFVVPNLINPSGQEIQVSLKREHQRNDDEEDRLETQWKLDLKLDIGKRGQLLAKTIIRQQSLSLGLYASNDALKRSVEQSLPKFGQRLNDLGISLVEQKVYVAKIPSSLMETQLSTMKTYA
ncbi:hypothetical protein [Agaribacter flavus]|uniref:Flagellar hook-length control protein FliK n=1 Tax=Agaribacter flavus TaxID=1902781 RepID=A0ABV7FRJ2_9ALTE